MATHEKGNRWSGKGGKSQIVKTGSGNQRAFLNQRKDGTWRVNESPGKRKSK